MNLPSIADRAHYNTIRTLELELDGAFDMDGGRYLSQSNRSHSSTQRKSGARSSEIAIETSASIGCEQRNMAPKVGNRGCTSDLVSFSQGLIL